jgi:outer membrane lipoprotein SlyB
MKQFPVVAISSLTLVSMMFSACETETPGRGAAHGAMAGAVIGAIAGGNIRSAAIGAAAGAAAGAVVGKVIQDERRERYPGYEEDRYYGAYGERPVHR